jgi:hypothetical protein
VVLEQVGGHLGYTGRGANPFGKAAPDPDQSSAAVFGNEVDIDQHLTKCIVGTVKVMLAVCSLEICCSKVSHLSSLIIIWRRADE